MWIMHFAASSEGSLFIYIIHDTCSIFSLPQRNCVYYALTARLKKVYQPHFNFHVKLYRLVTSSAANVIILIALGLNTALLALQVSVCVCVCVCCTH